MAGKSGDLARDQLEPWTAVAKPWTVERGDLISSLALSSIGSAVQMFDR